MTQTEGDNTREAGTSKDQPPLLKPARETVSRLQQRRKTLMNNIRFYSAASIRISSEEEITVTEILMRKEKLETLGLEFRDIYCKLEDHEDFAYTDEFTAENCTTDELILKAVAHLRVQAAYRNNVEFNPNSTMFHQSNATNNNETNSENNANNNVMNNVRTSSIANDLFIGHNNRGYNRQMFMRPELRLATINLPEFSGKYVEWQSFYEMFVSLVHNNPDLDNVQKMHYLKSKLTGSAAKMLNRFKPTSANYIPAWEILIKRFQNKRIIVNEFLDSLLSAPALTSDSPDGLRNLIDLTNECIYGVKALDISVNDWNPWIVLVVTKKLDHDTNKAWEEHINAATEIPDYDTLMEFLEVRYRVLEGLSKTRIKKNKELNLKVRTHTATTNNIGCYLCNEPHTLYFCEKFRNYEVIQRRKFIVEKGLCLNCFNRHTVDKCKSKYTCRKCSAKHNTLLHIEHVSANVASTSVENNVASMTSSIGRGSQTLLATAIVKIPDKYGNELPFRALIDQGSQATFITQSAAQLLGVKQKSINVPIVGIGDNLATTVKKYAIVDLKSIHDNEFKMSIEMLVLPSISKVKAPDNMNISSWKHLEGIKLADPKFMKSGKFDLLLGADVVSEIILDGLIKGPPGTPMAQNTRLGWILSGKIDTQTVSSFNLRCFHIDCKIDEKLEKFWENETIDEPRKFTAEEQFCEDFFEETYYRNEEGRFVVSMPFKSRPKSKEELGTSRPAAIACLLQMEKKFKKDPKFKKLYCEFIQELIDLGHMKPSVPTDGAVYHLPHHAVLKETSTTTKLRSVFNASCKTSAGVSINDLLAVGPTLQDKLYEILLRWRLFRFVFSADIEKMFRQLLLNLNDVDFQRMLFRFEETEAIIEFTLLTVIYGFAFALHSSVKAVRKLAELLATKYPLAALVILRDSYVDDLMSGVHSITVGKLLQKELIDMLKEGCFNLRKWTSNDESLLEDIPEDQRELKLPLNVELDQQIKALGVQWDPVSDAFKFKIRISVKEGQKITKRKFLSDSSTLFDPMGWLAPSVIITKILFQDMWKQKLDWDHELTTDLKCKWEKLCSELNNFKDLQISRWLGTSPTTKVSLHGFSDASMKAMAAVVYVRVDNGDEVLVNMLTAKTKVAPISKITVPRLELNAAVLLSKLLAVVSKALGKVNEIPIESVHAWTDSTVVLAWLNGDSDKYQNYVSNRLIEIKKHVKPGQWKHVSSGDNPADCASRGMYPSDLINHTLWWNGPDWLQLEKENWPMQTEIQSTELEMKKIKGLSVNQATMIESPEFIYKYSSYTKLVRVMAYALRFLHNSFNKSKLSGYLSTIELKQARNKLAFIVQHECFTEEINTLQSQGFLKKSKNIGNLNPFIDEKTKLLRVGGRLSNHIGPFDKKHPIVLPAKHYFTELVIQHAHQITLHGGNQLVLQYLRQQFWIIRGKSEVSKYIRNCIICFRHKSSPKLPLMGDLPKERVNPSRCFSNCGIDFAGPLILRLHNRRKAPEIKCYIVVFVCFATKAVHLELASDLSTDAFLAAFRRFVSRRGLPTNVFTDNGTNFVGASNELPKLLSKRTATETELIVKLLTKDGIQWHFNPPASPNFGGLWESVVKSTKYHIKRILGDTKLTFEEMTTTLAQIECCLNSRPICPLSENPDDLTILTPGHFLIGDQMNAIPEPDLCDVTINRLSRWQLVQRLSQNFWKKWSLDYLDTLQKRNKWKENIPNLEIGMLVLMKKENLPPTKWPLGRVIEVFPGSDGVVRVVDIKCISGIKRRPVSKLCLLPFESSEKPLSPGECS